MKGQYRVVKEILLFAVGVAIASFVIVSFQSVEKASDKIALQDQLSSVSNAVIGGMVKGMESGNSIVRLPIPDTAAGKIYSIKLDNNNKEIIVYIFDEPSINVTKKVPFMEYSIDGEVISSAKSVDISVLSPNIIIKRSV